MDILSRKLYDASLVVTVVGLNLPAEALLKQRSMMERRDTSNTLPTVLANFVQLVIGVDYQLYSRSEVIHSSSVSGHKIEMIGISDVYLQICSAQPRAETLETLVDLFIFFASRNLMSVAMFVLLLVCVFVCSPYRLQLKSYLH